eukprot:7381931-Pyramimonas_sp.AAC.1
MGVGGSDRRKTLRGDIACCASENWSEGSQRWPIGQRGRRIGLKQEATRSEIEQLQGITRSRKWFTTF